jgi:hypothetical protein
MFQVEPFDWLHARWAKCEVCMCQMNAAKCDGLVCMCQVEP